MVFSAICSPPTELAPPRSGLPAATWTVMLVRRPRQFPGTGARSAGSRMGVRRRETLGLQTTTTFWLATMGEASR